MAAPESQARDFEVEADTASFYEYRDRWAVLVGISEYQYKPWNLKYAHRDADELANLLRQPSFGGLDDVHMKVLTDQNATTGSILKALRTFLRQPAREDFVLLHFSCHGTPDPYGEDEMYLVTYDTDPDDIPATALPMREVQYAVDRTLKAERYVILADTCHSGALGHRGRTTRSAAPNAALMAAYMKEIGTSKPGRAMLMSAEGNELSLEDARWGGGHGLFSYHLIEGLKGGAEKDGRVKAGDLFDYVYERVKEDSGHKQHPIRGMEQNARGLVLATTAHLSAEEHYAIGYLLEEMGRLLDDPRRYESASRQLDHAFSLAKENGLKMTRAAMQHGLARLSAGQGARALTAFESALAAAADDPEGAAPAADAQFYRAVALLDTGRPLGETLTALDDFLARHPDDPRADCARSMRTRIERDDRSRRRALLIGIGVYEQSNVGQLRGPANDLQILEQALIGHCGFQAADIKVLADRDATRAGVLDEFRKLALDSGPEDVVVVYFSGHGFQGDSAPYWVTYDASWNDPDKALKASEVHECIRAIPSSQTVAILDTHPNDNYMKLVRGEPAYILFLGASPGEQAYDIVAGTGAAATPHGAFTFALVQALEQGEPAGSTPRLILRRAFEELHRLDVETSDPGELQQDAKAGSLPRSVRRQTPLVVGDLDQALFRGLPDYPRLFRFSRRRFFAADSLELVGDIAHRTQTWKTPFPGLRHALGRAYLELGQAAEAIRVLEDVPASSPDAAEMGPTLACAYALMRREEDARGAWRRYLDSRQAEQAEKERLALAGLQGLIQRGVTTGRALLVGINAYEAAEVPTPKGAVADVDSLSAVLIDRWGFRAEDVTVLTDAAATRDAILAEYRKLAEASQRGPCLFVFSGVGSVDEGGKPTIIAVDSRQRPDLFDDIDLADLAVIARQSPGDLIAILDAGWTEKRLPPSDDEEWRSAWRHAPRNERTRPANRDLGPHKVARSLDGLTLEIGRLTFYDPSLKYEVVNYEDAVVEGLRPEPGPDSPSAERTFGLLCHGLTSALWRLDPAAASAQDWLDLAAEQWTGTATKETTYSPVIVGGAGLEKPLFSPPMRALVDALTRLERAPIAGLIPRLKRLIEKQKRPEDSLNLGLCHEALGEWNDAIEALNEVKEHEEASPGLRAEAEYALGRSLYERNEESDLDRAIGELRDATGRDPNLAGAFYYLGRALHDSARRNLLDLSVNAFRKYLEAGAPLGHRDEVRRWIARSTESR